MAIHVRPTNNVQRKISSILRRIIALATSCALLIILGVAFMLVLKKFYYLPKENLTFISFTSTPEQKEDKPKEKKPEEQTDTSSSESSSSTAPDVEYIQPDLINKTPIVATDSPIKIDAEHVTDGTEGNGQDSSGLGSEDLGGFGDGFGIGDGFGDGMGDGDALASGDGNKADGGGRSKGFNDDIQVVFLLDASGSMNELFTAAADSMDRVLNSLKNARLNGKKTKVNVGLVIYGQAQKDGAPIKLSPFTTHVRNLKRRLSKVACDGSTEECGAAIAFATHNFEWNKRERDDMLKVIFIAGNEEFDQGDLDYRKAIADATSRNIIVNTIFCGEGNEVWEEAAELGNGTGLTLNIDPDGDAPVPPQEIYQTLKALHDIAPMPVGSLNTQQKHLKSIKYLTPPPRDTKTKDYASRLQKWVIANKKRIMLGYEWDAIEICRKSPNFTIESIGGVGNAPLELRGMSEDEIVEHIMIKAEQRTRLLKRYHEQRKSGDLGDKILTVLQEQAESKGITIDY